MINLKFTIKKSNYIESKEPINHLEPEKYCLNLSYKKAKIISDKHPNDLVIGADTIVYHNNKILGKPINEKHATKYLKLLSDDYHNVYTGVSILNLNENINENLIEKTEVIFNSLSNKTIKHYIKNYKPFDKAGAYGIQDWSAIFVKKINGCFYNVVGFPLPKFYILLNKILTKKNN